MSLIFISVSCYSGNAQFETNEENVDFLIAKGKLFWEQRTNKGSLEKSERFISLACTERPNDFELLILLSKIKYTHARFIQKDSARQKALLLDGSRIAKNAVLNHSKFSSTLKESIEDSSFRILSSVTNAPKEVLPGLYWWAVNQIQYLSNQPVLERLNQRELLEALMHRVLSLDPGFNYSGPYRFFGFLYTRIPGVELTQSETYFKQAINSHPEYLMNSISMAEYYHQKEGNREQFNTILKNVIGTDINKYPEIMNENYFSKSHAQLLIDKQSSMFE